jgi:transcriptional regulator with XRE-family HTH domain
MNYKQEFSRLIMDVKDRKLFKQGARYRNEDVARDLGYNRSYLSQLLGKSGTVTKDHIDHLKRVYRDLLEDITEDITHEEPDLKKPEPQNGSGYIDEYIALLKDQLARVQTELAELRELKGYLARLEKNQVMILSAQQAYQQFWASHYPPKRMTPEAVNAEIDNKAIELARTYLLKGIDHPFD